MAWKVRIYMHCIVVTISLIKRLNSYSLWQVFHHYVLAHSLLRLLIPCENRKATVFSEWLSRIFRGRRRACLLCVFLFSLAYGAQVTLNSKGIIGRIFFRNKKNFRQLWILFLGRILSGIAVSLYHTSFESWLIQEHRLVGMNEAEDEFGFWRSISF